ncbi:FG-GAP repeat protein [Enhygromyxa salina]|uniref:FG-GAP repeat protein n=1 Tax=Enhygromyxa salina TaxID=215803 RepID=A0A2S9XJZ1_9BACT|nr:FG-GAP repeat protein [Enhygromyxa salina]PRP93162.1 FG-GAP repeat protein [Enhygromyxa salina]
MLRVFRSVVVTLASSVVFLLASTDHCEAMDPVSAPLVPTCAFPSTVKVSAQCTGSYLGNGVVLTAGHCVIPGKTNFVTFGDADTDIDRFTVSVDLELGCMRHPNGDSVILANSIPHYAGVDLAYCMLDPTDANYPRLASVPTVPLIAPTGCIRDWIREELWVAESCELIQSKSRSGCAPSIGSPLDHTYPGLDTAAVGMGYESGVYSGHKRSFNPTFYVQVDNEGLGGFGATKPGSPTQLVTQSEFEWDGTPIPGVGTKVGDSGGPLMYRLPDDSWRVVGDLNGGGLHGLNLYEAAPAYIHWIEREAKRDVTPCHDFNSEDELVWTGECVGALPTSVHEAGGGDWANSCSAHSVGGATCGGWGLSPPLDVAAGLVPMPNHLWVSFAAIEAHVGPALALAEQGSFGDPIDVDAVQAHLYDAAYLDSAYTFLADIFQAGGLGGYLGAGLLADFDGDGYDDEVFSDPDHDCGKGRVIVVSGGERVIWSPDTDRVLGAADCEDFFGAGLAVGDFDGDGYDDLAVSAPGEARSGSAGAGSLHILYGSSVGLTASGDQIMDLDTPGLGGATAPWSFFAETLVSADFDCDGREDLAIGSPRATVDGVHEAGTVHVLYGTEGGLSSFYGAYFEGRASVGELVQTEGHFGASVAAGDFDNLGCADLAIGVPDHDEGPAEDAGQVHVFYGTPAGLAQYADASLIHSHDGFTDLAGANDRFGARLEVVPGDSGDALRILAPNEPCELGSESAVVWHVVAGGEAGLDHGSGSRECELLARTSMSTARWGDLEQLARLHAVRISRAASL